MRRRLESLLPAAVLLAFIVAAIVVNLLLSSAEDHGVEALEESVTEQVDAIARSQDQRFLNSFGSARGLSSGLSGEPFELVEGSERDQEELQGLLDLVESAGQEGPRSGFYLLDLDHRVTAGVLLEEDVLGSTFAQPGFDDPATSEILSQRGGVLPITQGLTTEEPVLTYILPIRGEGPAEGQPGPLRGSFVFEQVVSPASDLNKEIGQLGRDDTRRYDFFDAKGGVIGSSDQGAIGKPVDDERLRTEPAGLHRFDDQVVVLADVPTPGWRVAFRQDEDEFEESLAGPLQSTGRILILALLAGGVVLMGLLYRRLRAARAEQERLQRLSEAQQEFISIVSHELRTPVAGVLGFLETTLDHWEAMEDVERHTAVGRAASNARRLQAMTRDVLDTQNMEAGQLVHVRSRLDLGVAVQEAVDAARDLDAQRTIEVRRPDVPVWVSADSDRVQQVLANLLENARKNSPAVEPVEVVVEVADGEAQVSVCDHGAGIDDESLERIFDKFVRGRGESVSGTGLGLYISRQIINAHDGRIWAESPPGQGAMFHFVLPLEANVPA